MLSPLISLLAALGAAACATGNTASTTSESSAPSRTEYYYGTATLTSPDGKIPYGTPIMTLVRRDLVPGDGRIVETQVQEGRERVTTLRREGGRTRGTVFVASSDDGSIGGRITFEGQEWRWRRWTYALISADTRIEGSGEIDGEWIETEKYVVGSAGDRRQRITERLVSITREEYDRRHAQMAASRPSKRRR